MDDSSQTPLPPPPPEGGIPIPPPPPNTSGAGRGSPVPPEVDRWNWGAFLLAPIWLGIHRLWIPLAIAAAFTGLALVPNQSVQATAGVGSLLFTIWVARRGNAMAWRKRHWEGVEHFRHVQRRWAQGGLLALVAGIGFGVWSAVRLEPPGQFRAHDVAFEYPTSWDRLDAPDAPPGVPLSETPLWVEAVGQDEDNGVVVTALDIGEVITEADIIAAQSDIAAEIERQVRADGLDLIGPVTFARLGSLPGFEFSGTPPDGGNVRIRAVIGYHGSVVYNVVCISVPAGAAELRAGCEEIIGSFRLTGDPA